jgi:hypothetical protein
MEGYWRIDLNAKKDYPIYWVSFLKNYMAEYDKQPYEIVTNKSELTNILKLSELLPKSLFSKMQEEFE